MKVPTQQSESRRRRLSLRSSGVTKALAEEETLRLEALARYELIDAAPAPELEEITALAAEICGVPLAGISLIGGDAVYYQSRFGPGPARVPRGKIPCEKCLGGDAVYEITDAHQDEGYRPDGIMIAGRAFRFYAGAPLTTPSGQTIGCLFVQDSVPHTLTGQQRRALLTLSKQVIARFELKMRTGMMDRDERMHERVESTLQQSETRYRQLVEGSLGMVYTHDLAGLLLTVNAHAAESLGRSVDEMTGRSLKTMIPEKFREDFDVYLKTIAETGEAQGQLHIYHTNGDLRVFAFRNKLVTFAAPGLDAYVLGFGVDISEQVCAEEKLRALIHQSDSILEAVGDGIYGVDLAGRVTVINPAAAQMLGYTPKELLGRKMHEVIHHTRADGTRYQAEECPILGAIRKLDAVRVSDEVFWRKDGTSFPVEYVARPQIDLADRRESEAAIGVVVAFADTTERRALERMKDEFISTVSHELRTPLTSLRAALGLVTGGVLDTRPEKIQQMLQIAVGNTDRLIRLVNDILDLERIDSGDVEVHSVTFSALSLMQQAVNVQEATAPKADVRFRIEAGGIEFYGDPQRVLQALLNLLNNAAKFSPASGEVMLSARTLNEHEAQLDVRDEGPGVPSGKLESIFERFQQADASDTRLQGGSGLGLAISRSIINQHGGRIWVTSPPGEGATFHFTLPTHPRGHLR